MQFLGESLILAGLGGVAGAGLGAAVTVGYAAAQGWTAVVPSSAFLGGLGAAVAIGALAGLDPALGAARLTPAEALRSARAAERSGWPLAQPCSRFSPKRARLGPIRRTSTSDRATGLLA